MMRFYEEKIGHARSSVAPLENERDGKINFFIRENSSLMDFDQPKSCDSARRSAKNQFTPKNNVNAGGNRSVICLNQQ